MAFRTKPVIIGDQEFNDSAHAAKTFKTDAEAIQEWLEAGRTPDGLPARRPCGEPVMAGRVRPPDESLIPSQEDFIDVDQAVCVMGIDYPSAEEADLMRGLEEGATEAMIRAGDGRAWLLPTPYRPADLRGPHQPRPVIYRDKPYSGVSEAARENGRAIAPVRNSVKGPRVKDSRYVNTDCPWGWD